MGRSTDWLLAIAAGAFLAVMIELNGRLAAHSSAIFASWVAHGVGAAAAMLLAVAAAGLASFAGAGGYMTETADSTARPGAPLWAYLGGIPGAFTVVLASIAVNGGMKLSATLALMLVGQMTFGLATDRFGWFGLERRRLTVNDLLGSIALLSGCTILLLGARAP